MKNKYLFLFFCFISTLVLAQEASQVKVLEEIETSNFSSNGCKNISLQYLDEFVQQPVNMHWQVTSLDAAFALVSKTRYFRMTLIPRVNVGQRFGKDYGVSYFEKVAWQYQIESYFSISKKTSFWLLYGFSNAAFFPNHQVAFEWNQSFAHGWGMNVGARLLYWDFGLPSISIGVEKYVKNLWITLKPSVLFLENKAFFAANIGVRNYFKNPINFLHLGLTLGNSPEYVNFRPDFAQIVGFQSYGAYLFWQQNIYKGLCVRAVFACCYEEYRSASFRGVLGGSLGVSYYFK